MRLRNSTVTAPDEVLKVYAASTPEQVLQAATDLASARFIGHGTWKWTELQSEDRRQACLPLFLCASRGRNFSGHRVGPRMVRRGAGGRRERQGPRGAAHSAEIQYAMGNLHSTKIRLGAWRTIRSPRSIRRILRTSSRKAIRTAQVC